MSCVKSQPAYTVLLIGSMQMDKPRPYIGAALLCQNVLEDKNGVLSIINITDRLEYETKGIPQGHRPVIIIKGLIALRSGPVTGEFPIRIKVLRPNGEPKGEPFIVPPVKLRGGDHGANVILNMQFAIEEEGLHWFDIYFEDELLTRIPLMVVQRQESSSVMK
jgi:hypothetical protein